MLSAAAGQLDNIESVRKRIRLVLSVVSTNGSAIGGMSTVGHLSVSTMCRNVNETRDPVTAGSRSIL